MNARAVAAWSASCLFIVLSTTNPAYKVMVLAAALAALAAGAGLRRIRGLLVAVLLIAAFAMLLNFVSAHLGATVLFSLPAQIPALGGPYTLEALAFGASGGITIAAAILSAAPFSLLLDSHEVMDALPAPLSRSGVVIASSLNLVPAVATSFVQVTEAQRLRGWRPRGPRSWMEVVVPLVLTSVEDSIQLAESMEARGFGSGARTTMASHALRRSDWLLVAASGLALATLTHLSYWYPGGAKPALRDACLRIEHGLTVVAGSSGGGKSTLLRIFNGLVPHFHGGRIAGNAEVMGLDVIATPTRKMARHVGFVFQDPELQTVYNVVDREVAFGLENMAVPGREIASRVEEALHAAGVADLTGQKVRTLSGGERQRVALASAMAMRPDLVVLDEPTSQLDPDGAQMVLAAATNLVDEGRSVIISEHRLDRLLEHAAGVVLVDRGLVTTGDPREWHPPPSPVRPARSATLGGEAWSLQGVSA